MPHQLALARMPSQQNCDASGTKTCVQRQNFPRSENVLKQPRCVRLLQKWMGGGSDVSSSYGIPFQIARFGTVPSKLILLVSYE